MKEKLSKDGFDDDCDALLESANAEINQNDNADSNFMSPLTIKPMFVMARSRHPKTRNGRLAIFIVLPIGALDQENGIRAELETAERLAITFSWSSVLLMLKNHASSLIALHRT